MARPEKTGVDYFPLDIHMNDRIKLVEAKFGLIGFAVIVKLWAKIYGSGYYCEWNDDVALLFAGENKTSDNVVNEIMNEAVGRGIFDKRLYEKYGILTSKGIQKRYLMMTSRRKAVDLNSEYLLVDVPPNAVNVYINGINVNNNSINDDKSTQSKVNKIKLKIIKTDQKSPSFYIKYPFLYSFGINLIILPICSGEAGINASM